MATTHTQLLPYFSCSLRVSSTKKRQTNNIYRCGLSCLEKGKKIRSKSLVAWSIDFWRKTYWLFNWLKGAVVFSSNEPIDDTICQYWANGGGRERQIPSSNNQFRLCLARQSRTTDRHTVFLSVHTDACQLWLNSWLSRKEMKSFHRIHTRRIQSIFK